MNNYNYGMPISLDSIDKNNWEQAATDFSEGLESLKQCLLCMWEKGLRSIACCKGYHGKTLNVIFPTQILMQKDMDIFSYLSQEIINSPYVKLSINEENMQEILIYGEKRNEILQKITKDLMTGKKNNPVVGKIIQPQVRIDSYVYGLKINGFSDEEIETIYPKLVEFAQLNVEAEYYEDKYEKGELTENIKNELEEFSIYYEEIRKNIIDFILKKNQLETNIPYFSK